MTLFISYNCATWVPVMTKITKECSPNFSSSLRRLHSAESYSKPTRSKSVRSKSTLFSNKTARKRSQRSRFKQVALAMLAAIGGLWMQTGRVSAQSVDTQAVTNRDTTAQSADSAPNIIFEQNTGSVRVDRNAFQIETGNFDNGSGIPLPAGLVGERSEGVAVPTVSGTFAPSSVEFETDLDYIQDSFEDAMGAQGRERFRIRPDTVRLTREFNISYSEGNHDFAEGIEVVVKNASGDVVSRERAFVRGDVVQIGPDGETLPSSGRIRVDYSAEDTVELRVLNIRQDNTQPSESAIYFATNGDFVVEDLPEGGDRDFNDGDYVQDPEGQGEAIAAAELNDVEIETSTDETPLDPSIRTEEVVEQDVVTTLVEADDRVEEERDWGSVSLPESNATRLGHARGALSEDGELLIYDRYAASNQFRLGSNGVGITGQLKPLIRNPRAMPTLLFGNANFDPFVDDNEAGLVGTLGITQFLTRTHREATDMMGAPLPTPNGNLLLEPTGLFNNRRMVGYVPATEDEMVRNEVFSSVNGIFEIPDDQRIAIAPPDSAQVGRGNAAYTRNVGGVIIESSLGDMTFIPQWTEQGYAQEPITLEPGEAQRVIYALVPQQASQNIQLGTRYPVVDNGREYRIAAGDFTVISADKHPQNFSQELAEVYAVEDTLPGNNAITDFFNGIQGVYIESAGAAPVPTVDPDIPSEADARVGNGLFSVDFIPGDPGQMAYATVTRAGGFYLGGALTGGIGNQEDRVRRTTTEMALEMDGLRTTQVRNTFLTPLMQMDAVVTERTTITENIGVASFDISSSGELTNVNFVENGTPRRSIREEEISRVSQILQGEERQVDSEVISVTTEMLSSEMIEGDSSTTESNESYANVSSLEGEIALGGVYNFGNTPWSQAANTIRAELFARDSIFGRSGSETGWRAELLFHPFGEVKREASQYDANGNVAPIYKTQPVLDASGAQVVEMLSSADGDLIETLVNQYMVDENGDRVVERVGTGTAKGPGIYLRVEDSFDDDDGVFFAGGLEFAF